MALGVFDLWRHSKHDGSTLSEATRFVFATDTPEGRAMFEMALTVLHRHIVK